MVIVIDESHVYRAHYIEKKRSRIQGGPKKSKPLPIFQKIVLKIAKEIRFFRQVKV